MKNTSASVPEAIALRRMSLIQALVELLQHQWPLSAALEQVASTHPLPGDGEAPPQFVARRTLEDWDYAFKKGGFEGLKPKPRSDRGKPRRLSAAQQQWILEQVRSFPGVPVKLLYRQWQQADRTLPALSAVYRWLEQNDLDAQGRRYLLRQNIPGPTKAFEAPGVNDLWMVDFSPGPFLALHPKTVATHLCVIIDDHSRLGPASVSRGVRHRGYRQYETSNPNPLSSVVREHGGLWTASAAKGPVPTLHEGRLSERR